jgi:hypothetical protein
MRIRIKFLTLNRISISSTVIYVLFVAIINYFFIILASRYIYLLTAEAKSRIKVRVS